MSGGKGQAFGALTAQDLAASRYTEAEYFVWGTSQSFEKSGTWGMDGKWAVTPAARADYKIRMLVRRPSEPKRFNGILIVEWLNVTAMAEGAADYMQMKEEIERSGYAWVGIGAQAAGVNTPRSGSKAWDPERYATLVHPGDAFSYDIFTQARRSASAASPPGCEPARRVDACAIRSQPADRNRRSGSSPTSMRFTCAPVFDGFFVHSRGANAAGLTAEQLGRDPDPIPPGAHIRTDTGVPVFDLQTEGDMVTLRSHLTRQADSTHYRRWEIAGAAHAESPQWVPGLAAGPRSGRALRVADQQRAASCGGQSRAGCADAVGARRVVAALSRPPIELGDSGRAGSDAPRRPRHRERRHPAARVEAPTALLDGLRNDVPPGTPGGQNFCFLFGHTKPFDAAELKSLYPTHDAFVRKFNAAVDAMVRAGYWLKPEADLARAAAARRRLGNSISGTP